MTMCENSSGGYEMVARLLALALKARDDGDTELSEHLVAAAIQCEERANGLEAAARSKKE
jgi:hypothetical protein